jgi:hypothetical protein
MQFKLSGAYPEDKNAIIMQEVKYELMWASLLGKCSLLIKQKGDCGQWDYVRGRLIGAGFTVEQTDVWDRCLWEVSWDSDDVERHVMSDYIEQKLEESRREGVGVVVFECEVGKRMKRLIEKK